MTTCSNCSLSFPKTRGVVTVQIKKPKGSGNLTLSLKQALEYIFKYRSSHPTPDRLTLCLPCSHIFKTLIRVYASFLKRSKPRSPIYKFLKDELDGSENLLSETIECCPDLPEPIEEEEEEVPVVRASTRIKPKVQQVVRRGRKRKIIEKVSPHFIKTEDDGGFDEDGTLDDGDDDFVFGQETTNKRQLRKVTGKQTGVRKLRQVRQKSEKTVKVKRKFFLLNPFLCFLVTLILIRVEIEGSAKSKHQNFKLVE